MPWLRVQHPLHDTQRAPTAQLTALRTADRDLHLLPFSGFGVTEPACILSRYEDLLIHFYLSALAPSLLSVWPKSPI